MAPITEHFDSKDTSRLLRAANLGVCWRKVFLANGEPQRDYPIENVCGRTSQVDLVRILTRIGEKDRL